MGTGHGSAGRPAARSGLNGRTAAGAGKAITRGRIFCGQSSDCPLFLYIAFLQNIRGRRMWANMPRLRLCSDCALAVPNPLPGWGLDRHRGGGHPPTPATPPCVRVRTRRVRNGYANNPRTMTEASALTRSYPGLLTKNDPPKRPFGARLVARPGCQDEPGDRLAGGIQRPCAPSARVKPPVSSLASGQGLFFAWVTLSEHKWVTSRERRRSELPSGWIGKRRPVWA